MRFLAHLLQSVCPGWKKHLVLFRLHSAPTQGQSLSHRSIRKSCCCHIQALVSRGFSALSSAEMDDLARLLLMTLWLLCYVLLSPLLMDNTLYPYSASAYKQDVLDVSWSTKRG